MEQDLFELTEARKDFQTPSGKKRNLAIIEAIYASAVQKALSGNAPMQRFFINKREAFLRRREDQASEVLKRLKVPEKLMHEIHQNGQAKIGRNKNTKMINAVGRRTREIWPTQPKP